MFFTCAYNLNAAKTLIWSNGVGGPNDDNLKTDANGNFVWAKNLNASIGSQGLSIAVDAVGAVYTMGSNEGTIDLDPGNVVSSATSMGREELFISKLDALGNFLWGKSIGGPSPDKKIFDST